MKTILPLIATVLLAQIIYPYLSWELDIDFLQTKQHVIHHWYYRAAFYVHIFSSLPVLFLGAFLFSERIQKRYSKLHRMMGKGYVGLVLCLSAPSGMVLAVYANGGWPVQLSFLIATPLWWLFTWKGLQTALKKEFFAHRKWMLRSYALAFSAVTLRASQLFLNNVNWVAPEYQYLYVAWESWILNLFLVEIYLRWLSKKETLNPNTFVYNNGKDRIYLSTPCFDGLSSSKLNVYDSIQIDRKGMITISKLFSNVKIDSSIFNNNLRKELQIILDGNYYFDEEKYTKKE